MMVTFVSQCQKKALNRTRRVLDAFANRIGDNTWQTVITEEGLIAVKTLLRKTATKNTAVACHWIRSRSRSELVWIVGNRSCFNAQGIVPVNVTRKKLVGAGEENDWHYLPLIKSLSTLATLFHDWGKATRCFQNKLRSKQPPDPLRHEWMSILLLRSMIGEAENDSDWLQRLADGDIDQTTILAALQPMQKSPLAQLPNAASLIAWLVLSHHKLSDLGTEDAEDWRDEASGNLQQMLARISAGWGYCHDSEEQHLKQCFEFEHGLLAQCQAWLKPLQSAAAKLQTCLPLLEQAINDGSYRLILYYARMSLMLGDHYYSSLDADPRWQSDLPLYANTDKDGQLKQRLDEHLVRVARQASTIARRLPLFETLPPAAYDVRKLKQKSSDARFAWQDKAVAAIKSWKAAENPNAAHYGFFAVNMASTGCGKTLANAKIMQALSDNADSLRYVLALGLRTLTLQTGDEYRERIGLNNSELAVLIGSRAVLELHRQTQTEPNDDNGSESANAFWEDNEVDFDLPDEALSGLSTLWTDRQGLVDKRKQKFLYAPVLACTIDHMMAATETKRGGRHILPGLRLMSSDLVIDEVDDFDGSDLIAIGRLVHLAGMSGRKVMISSATIPPDLAEGYFNAYRAGWQLFAKTRDLKGHVAGAWIDEFASEVHVVAQADIAGYRQVHRAFIETRCLHLQNPKTQPKRIAEIVRCTPLPETSPAETLPSIEQSYFADIQQAIVRQHRRHAQKEPQTGKTVSIGVVRMANIVPCIALSRYLANATDWPEDIDIRIMAYHSQQVLLLRHHQEQHLDTVLKRKQPDEVFDDPVIRHHLHISQAGQLIFILVATPVEEVGRDHDFDWAIVEPSSYRSIIQLAGRVLRHRSITPSAANIGVMQYNLKSLKKTDEQVAFCHPGFESKNQRLATHDLTELIPAAQLQCIDAVPRIRRNEVLQPALSLADLEQACMEKLLASYTQQGPESLQGWLTGCWWLTALPQRLTPFRQQQEQQTLFNIPDDRNEWVFVEKLKQGGINKVEQRYKIQRLELNETESQRWWLHRDYGELLEQQAEHKAWSLEYTALHFGEINVRINDSDIQQNVSFAYCDQLGFWAISLNWDNSVGGALAAT